MPTRPNRPVLQRVVRRATAVALAVLFFTASAHAYATLGSARGWERATDSALPPQGLYEGCAPGTAPEACAERLATIRVAGFRYVLNYSSWYGTPAHVLHYADTAAALGLQLIWPLNHPAWRDLGSLSSIYSSLGEGGQAEFTAHAIGLVAGHPATWGFYIGDEPLASEASRVRQLSATVRLLAPDKPQLYIARPGTAQLQPFAPFADVAGADAYPIDSSDPPVCQAARSAHAAASTAGAQTAIVLQAFSWSQYDPQTFPPRYPSTRSLRAMRDAAIRHAHPAMILWYSYQDILRSDAPQRHWRELTHAAFARS